MSVKGGDGDDDGGDGDDQGVRLLKGAYALETPNDNLAYYHDFAHHYDQSFAKALGYVYPGAVAQRLLASQFPAGRVLDVGCGTGLVAAHIKTMTQESRQKSGQELGQELGQAFGHGDLTIDGVDLSPEMLAVAAQKQLYDQLYEADLTGDLSALGQNYAAIVSAGTFTHGHLGPAPLAGLINCCRAGAVGVIGVNAQHHEAHNFGAFMKDLAARGRITQLSYDEVLIYDGQDQEHAGDTALIMNFLIS